MAERQDWPTVQAILDYRVAKRAAQLRDDGKDEDIQENAALRYWDNVLSYGLETATEIERKRREMGMD